MEKTILNIKNLSKTYHTTLGETLAIENFSLEIKEGEFIAIVGPSGCGKSTILNILANLDTKSNGEIIFENNTKIGYMLQQDALFNWLTVLENCLLSLEISKRLTKESKQYVLNLLKTYGLNEFINSYPNTLSGGMRQRVVRTKYTHKI